MDDVQGAVCTPNISAAGRKRRRQAAVVGVVFGVVLMVALVVIGAPWYARAVMLLPAAMVAVSYLQVHRNTCVARAREGTFEHDDFSTTKVDDATAAASRRVARTITRDSVIFGVVCGALAVASAFVP